MYKMTLTIKNIETNETEPTVEFKFHTKQLATEFAKKLKLQFTKDPKRDIIELEIK